MMHSSMIGPKNLGNPQETTVLQTAQVIKALTNSSSYFTYHPLPTDDPTKRQPDISKAMKILNWKPQVSRKKGLENAFEYFKNLSFWLFNISFF